jgi:prevent-host-death family protein
MEQSKSIKTINAMKARQQLGTILEEIYYRGEVYIIERAGKPMAALVPLSLLEELQKSSPGKSGHAAEKGNKRQPFKRKT